MSIPIHSADWTFHYYPGGKKTEYIMVNGQKELVPIKPIVLVFKDIITAKRPIHELLNGMFHRIVRNSQYANKLTKEDFYDVKFKQQIGVTNE